MCRLAYVTKRFKGMRQWFAEMETSKGGHGNGVAIADEIWKGVNLSVDDTVTILQGSGRPALWHTRWCSSGDKCNELCHPFHCGKGWLVHNGHWMQGDWSASVLTDLDTCKGDPVSDTKVFAMLATKLGFIPACERYQPAGVWLRMDYKGRLTVYKHGGSLYYSTDLRCWGSEPYKHNGNWYSVADGLYLPNEMPTREHAIVADTSPCANNNSKRDLFADWVYTNKR